MIHGVGTDLIRIERLGLAWKRHGDRLVAKVLHPVERMQFARVSTSKQAAFLAKSFATKEAFGKALGTGVRGFGLNEVGIERVKLGRPVLRFSGALEKKLRKLGVAAAHLSISDEGGFAFAFVVLERAATSPAGSGRKSGEPRRRASMAR